MTSIQLPYKFGRYLLLKKIAQGGMAEIYKAKYFGEGGFVKEVAVKRILPVWSDNKEFVAMLCDEARALVQLQNQNIVQVFELGKDNDLYYISMEYVRGVDLRRLFKTENKIPLKFVTYIICEVLKGLDFAHNRKDRSGASLKIIHRDISPQNILLSFNGEVKIADFGIAKGAHRTHETKVSQIKGKYAYMSPEQAEGRLIDQRADLYAAGVILYELLSGKRLYDSANDLLTIEEVKKSILPKNWEDDVLMGIRPIVRKSLQKNAAERYQSAAEFLNDLNLYITANKIFTHSIEFSAFLREIFDKEYESKEDEENIRICEMKKETMALNINRRHSFFRSIGLAFSILMVTAFSSDHLKIETAQNNSTEQQIDVVEKMLPPEIPKISENQAVKIAAKPATSKSKGVLSVQARPWGYVYIPGFLFKKETPVKDLMLASGDYLIKVNFEPEDKWAQQKIKISDNSKTLCIVDFSKGANMTCKSFFP